MSVSGVFLLAKYFHVPFVGPCLKFRGRSRDRMNVHGGGLYVKRLFVCALSERFRSLRVPARHMTVHDDV